MVAGKSSEISAPLRANKKKRRTRYDSQKEISLLSILKLLYATLSLAAAAACLSSPALPCAASPLHVFYLLPDFFYYDTMRACVCGPSRPFEQAEHFFLSLIGQSLQAFAPRVMDVMHQLAIARR